MARRGLLAGAVGAAVVATAVVRGVSRRFAIREASMSPALEAGDWVIARRRTGGVERGDIVVFPDPMGTGMQLVKRVIGLPGERVGIAAGRVTVDGALLADRWASGSSEPNGTWQVPEDAVWVLGDNRAHSVSDGRVLGPVPLGSITWVVVARYWPRHRIGVVG